MGASQLLAALEVKIDQTVSELRKELKAFKGVKDGSRASCSKMAGSIPDFGMAQAASKGKAVALP